MNRRIATLAVFSLLMACRDDVLTSAPPLSARSISDAASGGSAGFYFLPPLVPKPSYAGTFDALANPTVQVCNDAGCNSVHASFTKTTGTGGEIVRVEAANELYMVNWNAEKSAAVAGTTYRVRVLVDGVVAGFTDVLFKGKGVDATNVASNETVVMVNGNTLPIKFRIETRGASPLPAPSCTSCLEVLPTSFLLTGVGDQRSLRAFLVNAVGSRTPVTPTWTSSDPAALMVSSAGVATAVAAVGSSLVTASANGLTSAPVMGVVASPVAGALLIADDQVEGVVTADTPGATYGLGWRYRVRLRGVSPVVEQVVMTTGSLPIGGKVVTVTPAGTGLVDVVLEVVPLSSLFTAVSIAQRFPASAASAIVAPGVREAFAVTRQGNQLVFTPPNGRATLTSSNVQSLAQSDDVEFDIGPFECEASLGASFPISLSVSTFTATPTLTWDVVINGLLPLRLVAEGTVTVQFAATPTISAAATGEIECKFVAAVLVFPITGALQPIFGGRVPVGVGFGGEVEASVGGVGFDITANGVMSGRFGWDCTPTCSIVGDASTDLQGTFKPVVPSVSDIVHVKVSETAFAFLEMEVAPPIDDLVELTLLDATAGLEQSADLRSAEPQRADANYASKLEIGKKVEIKAGLELSLLGGLWELTIADFTFEPNLPKLSRSPTGTFAITPASVGAGDNTSLGDTATFIVSLSDVTYLGAYAVESVEILWYKNDGSGNFSLQAGRPGCTSLAASTGQTQFTCKTDFVEADTGSQRFHAFVKARIGGTSVPTLLEIANDAKATVDVTPVKVTVTPDSVRLPKAAPQQFAASVTGTSNTAVTWTATGGTITATGLYTAGNADGSFHVIATSDAFPSRADTAKVTIGACSQPPCLFITPSSATTVSGQPRTFVAYVDGAPSNLVTWSTTTFSSISSAGVFLSSRLGTYTVTATSIADPTLQGSATVTVVVGGLVAVNPTIATLRFGASRPFAASGSIAPYTWSIDPGAGSITPSGTFTAGSTEGEYSVIATSSTSDVGIARVWVDPIAGNYTLAYQRGAQSGPALSGTYPFAQIFRQFASPCVPGALRCYATGEVDLGTTNLGACTFTQVTPGSSAYAGSCQPTSTSRGGTLTGTISDGILNLTLVATVQGTVVESWTLRYTPR